MGTALDDALERIRSAGGIAPTGGVSLTPSTPRYSTALTQALQAPQVQSTLGSAFSQWEPPPVKRQGPSGAIGNVLNALGWAKSAVWSTAKEGIDLFQGEGFSGSDWWNQATTDYGFGNLIHDERDVVGAGLIAMSPFTMGISGIMGGAVLADNIHADRVMGFIGDVAVDPLTYMGGLNVITRGLAGARKARMGLVSMKKLADPAMDGSLTGIRKFMQVMGKDGVDISEDVARKMLKDVDDAILASQKLGSMGSIARSLNKTDTGKLVAKSLGFDPGLRLRVPFTGAVSQRLLGGRVSRKFASTLGLDEMARNVKIPEMMFQQRFKNVPQYFKGKYTAGRVEDAMRVMSEAKRPMGRNWTKKQFNAAQLARQKLRNESVELAELAGKAASSAVEFMPKVALGRNAAKVALGASLFARGDFPMRAAKRVFAPAGSPRAQKLSKMFGKYGDFQEEMDSYLLSGDPNKVAEGWMMEDYIRHARGKETVFKGAVREGREKVARRAKLMGFTKDDGWLLSQLEEADILRLNADGVTYRIEKNNFYDNLDPRLKNMSDEDLLMLKAEMDSAREEWTKVVRDEMRQKSRFNPGDDNGNISGKWDAEEAIRAEEGDQFLHRKLSDTMSGDDWFGVEDTLKAKEDWGVGHPHSLKNRVWRVVRNPNNPDEFIGGVKIPDNVAERVLRAGGRVRLEDVVDEAGDVIGQQAFLANADGTKFIIQDPRVVGKSVRRQIDEAMRAASGEDMFESDWFKLMDHGNIRMGREVRLRSLANRHQTRGAEFEDHWKGGNVQGTVGGWGPQGPRRPPPPRGGPPGPRRPSPGAAPSTAQVAEEAEVQYALVAAGTDDAFARAKAASGGGMDHPALSYHLRGQDWKEIPDAPAEAVPVEWFDDLVETTRPELTRQGRERVDEIKEQIARDGIEEPIRASVNPATGRWAVTDGNHRLVAARELGFTDVPVVAWVEGASMGASPSKVGIPTRGAKAASGRPTLKLGPDRPRPTGATTETGQALSSFFGGMGEGIAQRAQAVSPVVDEAADVWRRAQLQVAKAVPETKIIRNRWEEIGERLDEIRPSAERVADGNYRVPKEVNDLIEEADGLAARLTQIRGEVEALRPVQQLEASRVMRAADAAPPGPWTRKLLNTNAQRQADVGTGKSVDEMSYGEQLVDLDRFAEKIDVPDPTYGPLGEITINYNHPWYRSHGERVAEISWNPKETFGAGLFEKTPLQQAPVRQRAAWARPVLRKVKQIVDEMTDEGITVVADVAKDRRSLIRLYENAGFVQVPRGAAPVSTAAQQTPLDLSMLAREGMVEMVRQPTSQTPAATYQGLDEAFDTMVANVTNNIDTMRNEIAPLITQAAERIKLADRTVQAMDDLGRAVTGTPGVQRFKPIAKFKNELDEITAIDEVVRHNEFIDGVPTPQQTQQALSEAATAVGEATQRVGAEAVLAQPTLADAARGVARRTGEQVSEDVAQAGALDEMATDLVTKGADDFEAYQQLSLLGETDLADAALITSRAQARDAIDIATAQAPMEAKGVVVDEIPGKLFGIPTNVPTAALMVRDMLTNWDTWRPRGGAQRGAGMPPGGGGRVPPGNGGVGGMAGGAPWDDEFSALIEGFARVNDPAQFASRDSVFWQTWDKFQNFLKAGMIATPGFVQRNIMGAFFNAWLDGVAPSEIIRAGAMTRRVWSHANKSLEAGRPMSFIDAARELAKDDALFNDYVGLLERGVRGGGQAVTAVEMQQTIGGLKTLDYVFGAPGSKKVRRVTFAPWSSNFLYYKGIREANGWVEDMIRLGVGMDTLKNGGSFDDALGRIAKSQFDYGELTRFEQEWVRRFVPFYTWTRKNVPYQLKQLGAHPYKYNRLMAAKRNLELGTKEEGVVPDYYLEPFGIRMPFSRKGATVYSVPDLPFQDLLRLDPTGAEGPEGALRSLLWQLSPVVKTPIEVLTKHQMGAGIPFRGKYQTVPKPLTAMKFLMPLLSTVGMAKKDPLSGEWRMRDHHIYAVGNMLPVLGQLRRIWPNEERYQKRQLTALMSFFGGLNVQFNTPDVQYRWQASQKWAQTDALQDLQDLMYPQR